MTARGQATTPSGDRQPVTALAAGHYRNGRRRSSAIPDTDGQRRKAAETDTHPVTPVTGVRTTESPLVPSTVSGWYAGHRFLAGLRQNGKPWTEPGAIHRDDALVCLVLDGYS